MTHELEFDPRDVERCAVAEGDRADVVEDQCKFPDPWFSQFVSATGPVCKQVHEAVHRFFVEREECGKRLAAEHRRCRDGLRAFNNDMQCTDEAGANSIIASSGAFSIANYKNLINGHSAGQSGVGIS